MQSEENSEYILVKKSELEGILNEVKELRKSLLSFGNSRKES